MEVSTKKKISLIRAASYLILRNILLPLEPAFFALTLQIQFLKCNKVAKAFWNGETVRHWEMVWRARKQQIQTKSQQNRPDISYQNLSNSIWEQSAYILHIHISPGKNLTLKNNFKNLSLQTFTSSIQKNLLNVPSC